MTGNASPLEGMGRVCICAPSLRVCATADLWMTSVAPMPAANRKKPTRDKCFVRRHLEAELFAIGLLRFDSPLRCWAASFHLDALGLDHLGPFVNFVGEMFCKPIRRQRHRVDAQLRKSL